MHSVVAASTALQRPIEFGIDLAGLRLSDLVDQAIGRSVVPARFRSHGRIEIDGLEIPRENWRKVKPKPGRRIYMLITHAGGGDSSGKNILAAVAAVLLVVVTGGIAAGGLVALGASAATFGVGTLGASIAAGVVGLVGQLAISALFKPPAEQEEKENPVAKANDARVQGNALDKGQTLPRVVGTFRVYPPFLAQPRSYLSGDDVYAEAVLALAGPHSFSDIHINGVPIDTLNGVESWTDDGTSETRDNEFDVVAYTERLGVTMTQHKVRFDEPGQNDQALAEQGANAVNSLPQWHRFTTRAGCAYADVFLVFAGLWDAEVPDGPDAGQVVYIRMRARKEGESSWKNIGTIPYVGYGAGSRNRRIRLYFRAYNSETGASKNSNGFRTPATLPVVDVDHVEFKTTDSDHFPAAYTFNWVRQREGIDCYLNDSYFFDASARYEFEIKRSEMVAERFLMTVATMQRGNGDYLDYCDANDGGSGSYYRVTEDVESKADAVLLQTVSSVFEIAPVPDSAKVSTIQIRVKNQDFTNVSVLASGLVPDWNGSIWTGAVATSNPAPHFRYALNGPLTAHAIDVNYIDDDTLIDWRAECTAQGYECNTLLAGGMAEILDLVASCGYARPNIGLKYGVIYHRDTTAETATQMFTARNIRNLSWTMAYSQRPIAFNCEFANEAINYELDEIVVYDPYAIEGAAIDIEAVRYEGLTTAAQVTARAEFDFEQARRAVRYSFDIGIEHLATSRGEIAILSHDALHRHAAWARIVEIVDATSFIVDQDFSYAVETDSVFDIANVFAEEDFFAVGAEPGVMVRTSDDGVVVYPIASSDVDSRTVTIADTAFINQNDLVIFGPLAQVQKRVQVVSIEPADLETARVTVQDEFGDAPLINTYRLSVNAAEIAVTGQDVLLTGYRLTADHASIALTGQSVDLKPLFINVDHAAIALTAQNVGLAYSGDSYSFNLTAGDGPSSLYQGYSDGSLVGAMGTIDAEPIPGHTLIVFLDAISPTIIFSGDATAKVSGKSIWVDSVEYPFDSMDWEYDSEEDYTFGEWSSGQLDFTATVEYFCEIKPAS